MRFRNQSAAVKGDHQTLPLSPPDPTFPTFGHTLPDEASSPVAKAGHLAVILLGTGARSP